MVKDFIQTSMRLAESVNIGEKTMPRKIALTILITSFFISAFTIPSSFAYRKGQSPKYNPDYSKDVNGRWTRRDNLYKDTDKDGVLNVHDYNDSNPKIQSDSQQGFGTFKTFRSRRGSAGW